MSRGRKKFEEVQAKEDRKSKGPATEEDFFSFLDKEMSYSLPKFENIPSIQTGCDLLDIQLPGGGIPRRTVTEIHGPESVGKTTLTLHLLENAKKLFLEEQKKYKLEKPRKSLLMDYESIMDYRYAGHLKVKFYDFKTKRGDPNFHIIHPQTVEEAHKIFDEYAHLYGLVIIDSLAVMMVEKMLEEGEEFKQTMLKSQKITDFLNLVTKKVREHDIAVVCVNQQRVKMKKIGRRDVAETASYGNNSFAHALALRIELQPGAKTQGPLTDPATGERVQRDISQVIHFEVTKNKRGTRGQKGDFNLRYGHGFDNFTHMIEMGEKKGLVATDRSGYYTLLGPEKKEMIKTRGLDLFIEALKNNKEATEYLMRYMPYYEQLKVIRSGNAIMPSVFDDEAAAVQEPTKVAKAK